MKVITQKDVEAHRQHTVQTKTVKIGELFNDIVERFGEKREAILGHPTTNWSAFNATFGGARPGEVITLTSETGTGKTTFALNWMMDAAQSGVACFLVSCEIPVSMVAVQVAQMIAGKRFSRFGKEDLAPVSAVLDTLPIWFLDRHGMIEEELLYTAMSYAHKEFGCRFMVIDHLDYIIKERQQWQNESYVIGDTMRRLCGKTKEIEATSLVIAHPAKLNQPGVKRREIGLDELKGSSSIKQESDAVFGIYRPDPEKNVTRLRFLKIRNHEFGRFTGGTLRFSFNPESLVLSELSTGVEWGDHD